MAQVLHAPATFPGPPGPGSPPAFPPREPGPPYSVETPYGYRLDLDFLKYVDDIEKGHTLRRVPVQRRPRLGSLPRGSASWWTSTESLCSNASGDSRHSAYSYCGRGFYPQYGALDAGGPSGGLNPRVERTLLGARRRLEDQAGAPGGPGGLGSLTPSAAGSTGSLAGLGLPPSTTPRGSGLSTPVAPSAGHLALVREQMAGALRKLRQLEEQVKLIPVLQVKVSALQEEKRQLAVQLKSQRFLGRPRGSGELGLDLPEQPPSGRERPPDVGTRSVATWVREPDLGRPDGEALAARVALLEAQLQRALSQLRAPDAPLRADTLRVVEAPPDAHPQVAASTRAGTQAQRAHSLESYGAGLRALSVAEEGGKEGSPEEVALTVEEEPGREVLEAAFPAGGGSRAGYVHQVKKISITCDAGLPQTPPVSSPSPPGPPVASPTPSQPEENSTDQVPAPDTAPRKSTKLTTSCSKDISEETGGAGAGPPTAIRSIMKHKEEPTDPPAQRRSLQFVGVNGGGYESSSEDSTTAENFSDNESTENEAPEPLEEKARGMPETPHLRPLETAGPKASQEPPHVAPAEGASGSSKKKAKEVEEEEEEEEIRMDLSPDLISACIALEKYLGNNNDALTERELKVAYTTVLQEWLRLACRRDAHPELVRRHLITFRAVSARVLNYVVNIADGNGNTALHYSVSHANFPVVRQLLDSGVCCVDKQNRAGYSPIMLIALATLRSQEDNDTVLQLLRLGDLNAKASQAGQTALMLAVSHGRLDVVRALLACGADVNVQDADGSTALMCACEHGHKDIAGLLLAQPACDATLADHDGSTALTVALDAGQNEIASMLYSRMNSQCSFAPMSEDRNPSSSSAEE